MTRNSTRACNCANQSPIGHVKFEDIGTSRRTIEILTVIAQIANASGTSNVETFNEGSRQIILIEGVATSRSSLPASGVDVVTVGSNSLLTGRRTSKRSNQVPRSAVTTHGNVGGIAATLDGRIGCHLGKDVFVKDAVKASVAIGKGRLGQKVALRGTGDAFKRRAITINTSATDGFSIEVSRTPSNH